MFCIKCGKQIDNGNKFCIYCGEPVATDGLLENKNESDVTDNKSDQRAILPQDYVINSEDYDDTNSGEQGSSGLRLLLTVLIVILVLLLIVGGGIAIYMYFIDVGSNLNGSNSEIADTRIEENLGSVDKEEKLQLEKDSMISSTESIELSSEHVANNYEDNTEDENYVSEDREEEGRYEDDGIHNYEYFIEDVTWKEARDKCIEKGGHLLHIDSPEEYEKIIKDLDDEAYQKINFYIGGRREKNKDEYYWQAYDGEYLGDPLNSSDLEEYWLDGEPSFESDGKEEKYMDMIYRKSEGRWLWNDIPNDILEISDSFKGRIGYICEFDLVD